MSNLPIQLQSINEPQMSRQSLTPVSINEPPALLQPEEQELPKPALAEGAERETATLGADPDELEEEIEEAEEEGDFKPMHRIQPKRRR